MATITTMKTTMKAIRIHSFGGPDVLQLEEVPIPKPQPDELLVRIHAASVNPVDWKIREGHLGMGPLPQTIGSDFSGVVELAGSAVRNLRTDDALFGTVTDETGSYAEYALANVSQVARKPASLDHVHAAALPIAALTAWQALVDHAHVEPDQTVLIHGAAGGVGSFAVQFAAYKGAHVVGTASVQNQHYLRDLGADEVIDYRSTRFEDVLSDVDVVLDTQGGETQERSWKVLKKGGILISIVQPPDENRAREMGVRAMFMHCDHNRGDELARIADLVASEQVKVNVEKVFPLSQAREAQQMSQGGHLRGKVVLLAEEHGH
jgi:NADPH:quinone reductase-like Zn-dependent oxidoreductase